MSAGLIGAPSRRMSRGAVFVDHSDYFSVMASGHVDHDTASVYEILEPTALPLALNVSGDRSRSWLVSRPEIPHHDEPTNQKSILFFND